MRSSGTSFASCKSCSGSTTAILHLNRYELRLAHGEHGATLSALSSYMLPMPCPIVVSACRQREIRFRALSMFAMQRWPRSGPTSGLCMRWVNMALQRAIVSRMCTKGWLSANDIGIEYKCTRSSVSMQTDADAAAADVLPSMEVGAHMMRCQPCMPLVCL